MTLQLLTQEQLSTLIDRASIFAQGSSTPLMRLWERFSIQGQILIAISQTLKSIQLASDWIRRARVMKSDIETWG